VKLTTQAGEPGGLFWICLEGGTAADVVAIMLMGSILDEIDAMGGREKPWKEENAEPRFISVLCPNSCRSKVKLDHGSHAVTSIYSAQTNRVDRIKYRTAYT